MDRKGEPDAPVEEVHDVPLSLHDVFPHRHNFGELSCFQIALNITDEYKLIVYLIKFGCDQETSAKEHGESFRRRILLSGRV